MSDTQSNNSLGQDAIKGGIFFGSNLTPNGTFSNVPQTSSTPAALIAIEAKIILTLQQVKEELQKSASAQAGTSSDILSETSMNTFLQSYVQLLIDYSDMRNYVFFGSAYTELSYQINFLSKNYPFKSYFARDTDSGLFTLTPLAGAKTRVSFLFSEVLQQANFNFDNSGTTTWVNFDLVDKNGTRFPITNINFTGTGPSMLIDIDVSGTLSINNFVEYNPVVGTLYKGFIVSPKAQTIKDFEVSLTPIQIQLLNSLNPSPWPRALITNNIQTDGTDFENWVSDPSNMVSGYNVDDLGFVTNIEVGLTLTSGMTLDDSATNQLIRRVVPHRLIDELRDTDDKYFTRFVLLAGKMFDTIKVYIDFLKYTKELNYSPFNQLSPEFYRLYAEHFGFDLFDDESVDLAKAIVRTEPGLSYDNQENPVYSDTASSKTVKELQSEKQKRLLINLFYLYSTKGTLKCIETLAKLLGAPDGLVVFEEKAFDQTTGGKITKNEKVQVPKIEYEIDPDFLVDQNDINNPVNLPYVYRLKLDNDNIVNLRELDGLTDPQAAVQTQVVEFGTKTYSYGHFSNRSFATLQNTNTTNPSGYYFLPLTFPDKYCGITVEYMLPRNAYTKGVGKNLDEVSIHIGSLFKVGYINYLTTTTGGVTTTIPSPISTSNKFSYKVPQIFMESITSDVTSLVVPFSASFTITALNGVTDVDILEVYVGSDIIGGCFWKNTKKATALAITNAINFQGNTNDYIAYYKENAGETFTITVESKIKSTPNIAQGLNMLVKTNTIVDGSILGSNQTMSNGVPIIGNQNYLVTKMEGTSLVIRTKLQSELSGSSIERVAILESVFNADGLNHELRLIYRPEGVEVYQDFKYLGLARWRNPLVSTPTIAYHAYNCPKNVILSKPITSLGNIFAYPDDESNYNPGSDSPGWWDLLVGNPVGVDMFFKRVAVQELPSINHPDTLDFGISLSGQEVEKFSFNFTNQIKNETTGEYLLDQISIPCEYKSPSPYAPMDPYPTTEPDTIDTVFASYPGGIVTDIRLVNQTLLKDGEARFTQDIQNFFKLPNGEIVTIDSLFKFNGWSPTIHKDYTYKNFNEVYNNYQVFSEQVLVYLSLLSFMEMLEDKFKRLVNQFIPIVINISKFGRLIKPLEKLKTHYPNIHHICEGNLIGSPALGGFRIVHGSNEIGNTLSFKVNISKFITEATNTSPIIITTSLPHNLLNGTTVEIIGVSGNTAANGTWTIANVTSTTLELISSVGNGTYTYGGILNFTIGSFGTIDWHGSNVITAIDAVTAVNTTGWPFIGTNDLNTVKVEVDYNGWASISPHNINECKLVVTVGENVAVDNVIGFTGGYKSIATGGCFTVTVTNPNSIELAPGFGQQFINYSAEQSLDTYIYFNSEVLVPEPYFYIN